MAKINLLEFHNLFISQGISKDEIKQFLEIHNLKEHEFEDLNKLCEIFKDEDIEAFSPHIFENYYINYEIAQIGKEFDILRIGENSVVNIELKSQKDESKILKQLQKNYYYLSFLQKEIYCFTFINKTSEFYYFDKNNEKLELINVETILAKIHEIKDTETKIDDLFVPSNYLVSPFNNTEAFLKNEYFLTKSQEEIKTKILKAIDDKTAKIFSIEGRAGTGKTLLTYDIAKTLIERGHNVAIAHCAASNEGIDKLRQNGWNITSIRNFKMEQANIYIFDEAHRLFLGQLKDFFKTDNIFIFSHDINQKIDSKNKTGEAEQAVSTIIKSASKNHYEISAKIRHNKELASFIRKFFQLARIQEDEMQGDSYKDISFYYATDNDNAKIYVEYLKEQGWEYIYLTAFDGEKLNSVRFDSMQSAHKVIGQEFNNVVVIITPDFYYNNDKRLSYKSTSYYNPLQTLFQAVTRTRKKLKFVIINNPKVYKTCMEIIHRK